MDASEKKRILLIDDDTSLLVTLSDFLRFEGYDVSTAESGEQGLQKLGTYKPDLVILDMSMPGMGGIGFLNAICDSDGGPSHPVLVLTARANMAEFFANVEVDGFVAKPCSPEDLLMEVGRILFLRSGRQSENGSPAESARPLRGLLGEDDTEVAGALREAFTKAGWLFSGVERGPDVIEQAILQRPDVIVLKQVLSKMNGDAVAEMLSEMPNTKDIPIVLYDTTETLKIGVVPRGVRIVVVGDDPADLLKAAESVAS